MTSSVSALRSGDQLASTVCTTRVVVIRAPREHRPLIACAGSPMVPGPVVPQSSAADAYAATLIGKRYVDASEMALPVIWDAEACAQEVRRVAAKGCHSLTFSENPAAMGYPSFHSEHWDPLWRALCDTGTVLNVHIGSSGRMVVTAVDGPPDVMITLQPMNIVQAAADLLWSRVIKNFPGIKIALPEGGTGWIPYFLERVDRTFEMHATWTLLRLGEPQQGIGCPGPEASARPGGTGAPDRASRRGGAEPGAWRGGPPRPRPGETAGVAP